MSNFRFARMGMLRRGLAVFLLVSFSSTQTTGWAGVPAGPEVSKVPVLLSPGVSNSIEIPAALGLVEETFTGDSDQLVVYIQDAHALYGAQKSIARLIDYLSQKQGFRLVAAEGAPKGPIDTTPISWVPQPVRKQQVLEMLLRSHFITGPEFQHALSGQAFAYVGIEDPLLYEQNLIEYQNSMQRRSQLLQILEPLQSQMDAVKRRVYHKELYEFDKQLGRMLGSFEQNHSGVEDGLPALVSQAAELGLSLDGFPTVAAFLQIRDMAPKLDFKGVEKDLAQIMRQLKKEPAGQTLKEYLSLQEGPAKIRQLISEMKAQGLSEETFPHFKAYGAYLEVLRNLQNAFSFFEEVETLGKQVLQKITRNDEERKINEMSGCLHPLRHLIDLTMTRSEYAQYVSRKSARSMDEVVTLLQSYSKEPLPKTDWRKELQPFEYFYENAVRRDAVLSGNFLEELQNAPSGKAIVVTGGFHSEGLKAELKKKGISYLAVVPKIETVEGPEQNYLSILNKDKDLLPKILIRFLAQTINQRPGSLDPNASVVTLAAFLELSAGLLSSLDAAAGREILDETAEAMRVFEQQRPGSRTAKLLNRLVLTPGHLIVPNGTAGDMDIFVQPNTFSDSANSAGTADFASIPAGRRPFRVDVRRAPAVSGSQRSEVRTSPPRAPRKYFIQEGDYPDDTAASARNRQINQILRELSVDLGDDTDRTLRSVRYREGLDPYDSLARAFKIYEEAFGATLQTGRLADVPEIGAVPGQDFPAVSDQLLRILSFQALKEQNPEKMKVWAAMLTRIVPLRNTLDYTIFPGILHFLARTDTDLNGQIREVLVGIIRNPAYALNDPGTTLLAGTRYASEQISTEASKQRDAVMAAVNGGELFPPNVQELEPVDTPVNELLILLKPPDTGDNPLVLEDFFRRAYAFGYGPAGLRVVRGSAIPDNFIRRHYASISNAAIKGFTVADLSSSTKIRMESFYSPYEGQTIPGLSKGLPSFEFRLNNIPIYSFEDMLKDQSAPRAGREAGFKGLSKENLVRLLALHFAKLERDGLIGREEYAQYDGNRRGVGEPNFRLWDANDIETAPASKDLTLFQHKLLFAGKPFFIPNLFFWEMVGNFKSSKHTIVAIVLRERDVNRASFRQMRNNFLGKGFSVEWPLPGTIRWDGGRGKLGNRVGAVGVTRNIAHASASPLENLEMLQWFGRLATNGVKNVTFEDKDLLRPDQISFGQLLLSKGYSAEQILYMYRENPPLFVGTTATSLFKIVEGRDAAEALELLLKYEPPIVTRDAASTPPQSFQEFNNLVTGQPVRWGRSQVAGPVRLVKPSEIVYGAPPAFDRANFEIIGLAGPSGAGKGTLTKRLIASRPLEYVRLLQTTTRQPRPEEVEGVDYYFVKPEVFDQRVDNGQMTTVRKWGGAAYGIERRVLEDLNSQDKIPVMELQKASDVAIFKKQFPAGKVVLVLPMDIDPDHYDAAAQDRVADAIRKRSLARDSQIPPVELEQRILTGVESIRKLLNNKHLMAGIVINSEGRIDQAFSELEELVQRSEVRSLQQEQALGAAIIRQGKFGIVLNAAEGGGESSALPEIQKNQVRALVPVAQDRGRPITALELKLLTTEQIAADHQGSISVDIAADHSQVKQVRTALAENKHFGVPKTNVPIATYVLNHVRYLVPDQASLDWAYRNTKGGIPAEIQTHVNRHRAGELYTEKFFLQDGIGVMQQGANMGNFDALIQFVLSGQFRTRLREGKDIFAFSAAEELGGITDDQTLGLFAASDQDVLFKVTEADWVYYINRIDGVPRLKSLTQVIVRGGKIIYSNLPLGYEPVFAQGQLGMIHRSQSKVEPVAFEAKKQPEFGAYLVEVNGKQQLLSRFGMPEMDFNTVKNIQINTNQILMKADAILRFFGMTRDEYLEISQADLLAKVEKAIAPIETYDQIEWIPLLLNATDAPVPFPAIKRARFLESLSTTGLRVGFYGVNRLDADGFYPLVNERDRHFLGTQHQVEQLLLTAGLSANPASELKSPEGFVEFEDLPHGEGLGIRFSEAVAGAFKGKRLNVNQLSTGEAIAVADLLVQLKAQHSRFPGTNRRLLLLEAVNDYTNAEIQLPEPTQNAMHDTRDRVDFYLEAIHNSGGTGEFLEFLWNFSHPLQYIHRNVNTPAYLMIVNHLLGRPLFDRSFVESPENADLFKDNKTVAEHPVFGSNPVAQLPFPEGYLKDLPRITADGKIRILFMGAGEKYGFHQKLDYFQSILHKLPPEIRNRVEVHAWDPYYQTEISAFDAEGHFQGKKRVFPFDAAGNYYDAERNIHFHKLDINDPRQNPTMPPYDAVGEFNIVVNSRVEVVYSREPEAQKNLRANTMRHVAPGGLLLYDSADTDKFEVIVRKGTRVPRTSGFISYEDWAQAESHIKRIMSRFDAETFATESVSFVEAEQIIRTAYLLASKYPSEGQFLFSKQVIAGFVAHLTNNVVQPAAILVQHIPDEIIRTAFKDLPPRFADVLIEAKEGYGKPEGINQPDFTDLFDRALRRFEHSKLWERGAESQVYMTEKIEVYKNDRFLIEYGLVFKDEKGTPAVMISNLKTGQSEVIYVGTAESRRSEVRRQKEQEKLAVPESDTVQILPGLRLAGGSDFQNLAAAIQALPPRDTRDVGAAFSAREALQKAAILTRRENDLDTPTRRSELVHASSPFNAGLTVQQLPDGRFVVEETLARDMLTHGFAPQLAQALERAALKSYLQRRGYRDADVEADRIQSQSAPADTALNDAVYYFKALKYGMDLKDPKASQIRQTDGAREYAQHEQEVFGGSAREAVQTALGGTAAEGAILFTRRDIESGTITVPELLARFQDDTHGAIQLHYIASPDESDAQAQSFLSAFLGSDAPRLLFRERTNPKGIRIHTQRHYRVNSIQAAVNRVANELRSQVQVPKGESRVQDYQIILIGEEPLAKATRNDMTKFVDQGANIGLLTAAYLFIPYRGQIPDAIFGKDFRSGDFMNAYYLSPLAQLGFFLQEQARVAHELATQA